jgi:hypothetical protein
MSRGKKKSRQYIALMFIAVITYLVGNLLYNFKYLDLGYLIIIIVGFIRFVKIKEVD